MALKPDRIEKDHKLTFFMNEVGNRGGIVCVSTMGSGAALDQAASLATYRASASGGKPIGMLLNDVVNIDLTRQHRNPYKNEVQKGGKVTIANGEYVTDQIASGISIAAGDYAYLADGGRITNVNTGSVASPRVGSFLSGLDEDGFARVSINLP